MVTRRDIERWDRDRDRKMRYKFNLLFGYSWVRIGF